MGVVVVGEGSEERDEGIDGLRVKEGEGAREGEEGRQGGRRGGWEGGRWRGWSEGRENGLCEL